MNSKGFTLIEGMLGLSLMAISTLAFISLSLMMVKSNTTAMATSDMVGYLNQVRGNLQNADQITAAMIGNRIAGTDHFIRDPLNPSVSLASTNFRQRAQSAWYVSSVNFDSVVPVPNQTNLYRITISLSILQDVRISASFKNRVIGDVYCLAPGGTISTCVNMASLTLPVPAPPVSPPVDPDDWAGRHSDNSHYEHIHVVSSECGGH